MRTDEAGNSCPSTLGEYRSIVNAFGPSAAVEILDAMIDKQGPEAQVMAPDLQMRALLMPRLGYKTEKEFQESL